MFRPRPVNICKKTKLKSQWTVPLMLQNAWKNGALSNNIQQGELDTAYICPWLKTDTGKMWVP